MPFTVTAAEEAGLPVVMFVTMSACGYMGYKQLHGLKEKGFVPLKGTFIKGIFMRSLVLQCTIQQSFSVCL
jgi:hypothetical protein